MWERRDDDTNASWNAFCMYRDYGVDRGLLKAIALNRVSRTRYGVWCKWSAKYDWVKRCGAYDSYLDGLKRSEREKEFGEREKMYQKLTEKVLSIVSKRLDGFDPEELTQGNVIDWLKNSIDIERTIFGKSDASNGNGNSDGKSLSGQLEINFVQEFEGL